MASDTVTGHNGVRLHIRQAGDPSNPSILLIHGWSQSGLCWQQQMEALADRFHLIAPDLRGHGQSDKPDDAEAYNRSEVWAADIAAIIGQLNLRKPLLTGWSMGGYVACDYLRAHGDAKISGFVLVGSAVTIGNHTPEGLYAQRSEAATATGMYSEDLATNIAATLAFVQECTAQPLPAEALATMVGYNTAVPPHIRQACRLRNEDYRADMAKLTVPALILRGDQDAIVLPPLGEQAAAAIPTATDLVYPGIGHAPFLEAPDRFNTDLAAFATACLEPA